MAIIVFFLLRYRKSAHAKPEISYPNSIIPGNAVNTLNNNANGRTSTMIPDTDSESEEDSHVVDRQLSEESSSEQRSAKWKTHDGCGYFRWQNFLPSIDIARSINFRNAIEKFWVPIKNAIHCHPNAIETLFDGSLVRVQWGSSGPLSGALESP